LILSNLRYIALFFIFIPKIFQASNNISRENVCLNNLKKAKSAIDSLYLYNKLVNIYCSSNLTKCKQYYQKALQIHNHINKPVLKANLHEFMADAYWYANDFNNAMVYYLKTLRIGDSLHNDKIIAKSKYNIGWIKTLQLKQYNQVNYFYEALQIFNTQKDTSNLILIDDALGNFYKDFSDKFPHSKDSCLKYFLNSFILITNSSHKTNEAGCCANLAGYYLSQFDYDNARLYSLRGIRVAKEISNDYNYIGNATILAETYFYLDSLEKAKNILKSINANFKNAANEPNRLLYYRIYIYIFKKEKKYKEAFEYSLKYKNLSDSINEKIFNQNLLQKEGDYKLEKKDKALNELQLKSQLQSVKNKNNSYVILGLAIFGILILVILYFLFRSNTQKQNTNALLTKQNKIINEKKLEIEQSIHYAKGIQNAILPDVNDLKKHLPQSFIFYLPKDVVSGDFYWFHSFSSTQLLIAAADCTGHGVPGSLMSIVSMDKLNHSVFEKKLSQPSQILYIINNDIKNALKQDATNAKQKDGLDIALLHLNIETNTLLYSGANRPLWLIRNNQFNEYKATKSCIAGHTELNFEYQQQQISIQKNDLIIIFSDGYADQFGGQNGKKMMTKIFKDLLTANSDKPINEIEKIIEQNFNNWKSSYEQVDDVLVIGFKI